MSALTYLYALALRLLPDHLQTKHGAAMEQLFAQELKWARTRGRLAAALAGAAGLWDIVHRALYESRPGRSTPQRALQSRSQLLARCASVFAFAFAASTIAMLFLATRHSVARLYAQGASVGTLIEAVALSMPFTMALTIPMAVLLTVMTVFSALGTNGTLAAARHTRGGVRRLLMPVLVAAAGVAALAFVVTAEVVPRTNARLTALYTDGTGALNARSMTITQLRSEARGVTSLADTIAGATTAPAARAASFEFEVQKKFALPAACVVLTLIAMALAFRLPLGGSWLVVGASVVILCAYYAMLMTGEDLAYRMMVSPLVGMWGANAIMTTIALLIAWSARTPDSPADDGGDFSSAIRTSGGIN